ncbi:aspartate/glutamate racemase family protein [Alteribacter natronophilus]|uniref:aspartate/glutamate racemase family protein n=1 Tax=Alteribacter natronophilus TaxID=2583810 RepID=UPI00110DD699|nr:aspartate/glutamate racemase family protein [Alteribacter natronophilus]TMW73924.1 aspartate/glutamate racemase family protein [Alteribacter natronophilus]
MKTVGLIGGLSWESSAEYYRYINMFVKEERGGLNSAKCLMHSFNFAEIVEMQHNGEWEKATQAMLEAAKTLERSGAEAIVICTNTMHKMAEVIEGNVEIPLIHIADATAVKIKEQRLDTVGLIGTNFTMEQDFYKERLKKHGIDVVVPDERDRQAVHNVIYEELCQGVIKESSKNAYLTILSRLAEKGAQGVVLGCTEIPLLINQKDTSLPLFDTTYIHSNAVAEFALK